MFEPTFLPAVAWARRDREEGRTGRACIETRQGSAGANLGSARKSAASRTAGAHKARPYTNRLSARARAFF